MGTDEGDITRAPARRRNGIRFVREAEGQDLVEYALLMALVGIVGLAAMPLIQGALGAAYTLYNTGSQDLWQPPPPGA